MDFFSPLIALFALEPGFSFFRTLSLPGIEVPEQFFPFLPVAGNLFSLDRGVNPSPEGPILVVSPPFQRSPPGFLVILSLTSGGDSVTDGAKLRFFPPFYTFFQSTLVSFFCRTFFLLLGRIFAIFIFQMQGSLAPQGVRLHNAAPVQCLFWGTSLGPRQGGETPPLHGFEQLFFKGFPPGHAPLSKG